MTPLRSRYRAVLLFVVASACGFGQPLFNKSVAPVHYAGPPENAIYGYSNGLFRSKDNGQTWVALHMREPGLRQPAIAGFLGHPTNPRVLYAFTASPTRVWKTTDGGDRWAEVSNGLPAEGRSFDRSISAVNPDTLYVAIGQELYVTRNGGGQWTRLATLAQGSSPSGPATTGFAAAPSRAGRLYSWSGSSVSRSDDDGITWRTLPLPTPRGVALILDAAVHPGNADELVVMASYYQGFQVLEGATLLSADGGLTYRTAAVRGSTASLFIDHAGNYHYYGCCRDYCRSADKAQSWRCTRVGEGPNIFSVDPQNAEIIYYGETSGVSRSTDGGATRPGLGGIAKPTLERPEPDPKLAVMQGSPAQFTLPLESVEWSDWRLPFSVSGGAPWLRLSPLTGETPASVAATIDTTGLSVGVYPAELTLQSTQAASDTKVPLSLVVTAPSGGPAFTTSGIAGGGTVEPVGFSGPATQTRLSVSRIALDAAGNVYAAQNRYSVHRIDSAGRMTHVAGTGVAGNSGDGGPATSALMGLPVGVATIGADVYVMQLAPSAIRKISGGTITTAAPSQQILGGTGRLRNGADGTLIWANGANVYRFAPSTQRTDQLIAGADASAYTDVARGPSGAYYVLETSTHRVYLLRTDGSRTVVAGSGLRGFAGDGGPAAEALLSSPVAIAVGGDGVLYIADNGNARVRAVGTDGVIRTIAGNGSTGAAPTGTLATQMSFDRLVDLAVSPTGDLVIAQGEAITRLTRAQTVPAVRQGGFLHQSTGRPVLAPGGYFSIYGTNLAPSAELTGASPWPTRLNGVEVRIQGRLAPLFYVSPEQINGQVPYETANGEVTASITANGVTTSAVVAEVRRAAPGVLTYGAGRAVAVHADGGINGVHGGAAPGDTVVVYLTGVGPVAGAQVTGAPAAADPLPGSTSQFRITVGGVEAVVGYLGLTPVQVGLAQANVVVPRLDAGDHQLVVTVDGVESNAPLLQVR